MGAITSGVGLISGLNTADIINELMSIESQPADLVQAQINDVQAQQAAYNDLAAQLTAVNNDVSTFATPENFLASTATSSDPNTLSATANNGAAVGTYQFQVTQLVTTQQSASTGFANENAAPVGAGTMTFMLGGGSLVSQNNLSTLRGGAGVPAGQFRITDGAGNTAVINTSGAVTLADIVQDINTNTSIDVTASIQDGALVVTDESGQTKNPLTISDVGTGQTAADLGIAGSSSSGPIVGNNLVYLSTSTPLSEISDGRGVRLGTGGNDLSVQTASGSTFNVSLGNDYTIGDVINSINSASGGKVTASLTAGSRGLTLTDNTGGGGTLAVTDANGSHAAEDLGLTAADTGGTIAGNDVLAGLGTVLLSSLNGGAGIAAPGTIEFNNSNGTFSSPISVDLSGAQTVQDIVDDINQQGGGTITASLNASQTGIQITDNSSISGTLAISDTSGTTAADLGIAGSYAAGSTVTGKNLDRQYITQNSLLSDLNGGQGIAPGNITVTNSKGNSYTVDLTNAQTLGDVIKDIDNQATGVTASIDASGSGLLLTDSAGGASKLKVTEDGSTTATDLNIVGTATGTTIDGSYTKSLTVTSSDTLQTLVTKINNLNAGVTASIIDDGSVGSPYRLSLTSNNSGLDGQVVIDSGTTNLGMTNLVDAQDAAVLFGGSGSSQPLLITSDTNQLSNVISGVTVSLTGTSAQPVTLSVSRTGSNISGALQQFTTDFNALVDQISSDTAWDSTNDVGGILMGDDTVQVVQEQLYNVINSSTGSGTYQSLADMGITIGDQDGHLSFDANTFASAYANDPTAVQNLFTEAKTGLGTSLQTAVNSLIDPVSGVITVQNQGLTNEATDYQTQLTQMDAVLAEQRQALETEYANLETTLAGLESQGSALDSLGSLASTSASKDTTSSSDSSDSSDTSS
jgi:flagellar hook-associated protein 2